MSDQKMIGTTGRGTLNGAKLSTLDADNHAKLLAYIQSVALGLQKDLPDGLSNLTSQEKHKVEFDTYTQAVQEYAQFLTSVGNESTDVQQETHTGSLNLSKIMEAAMSIFAGVEAAAAFEEFNTLMGTNSNDVGVSDFMNFWWNHVDHTEKDSSFKIGPAIYDSNEDIQFTILFSSMTFHVDDWRTMFIESEYQSFETFFSGRTYTYTRESWAKFGPDIESKLNPKIESSIKSAPLG
jgi:hypothetical protein